MKTKVFLGFLFLSSLLIAQPNLTIDSIVVKTSHDTIYVWDYNAWEQCAFQLDYAVEVSDSVITITQIDTAEDATTCYGFHDFVVPVINLNEGIIELIFTEIASMKMLNLLNHFGMNTVVPVGKRILSYLPIVFFYPAIIYKTHVILLIIQIRVFIWIRFIINLPHHFIITLKGTASI